MTGKTITLNYIRPIYTIKNLKELISETEDISYHKLKLIFNGHMLEDSRLIGDYNIQNECTIHITLRLVGG